MPTSPRVVDCSKNLKISLKNIGGDPFKHLKVKLIVCMSRLIDRGSHFKFFSVSESLVFKTILAALPCARSNRHLTFMGQRKQQMVADVICM